MIEMELLEGGSLKSLIKKKSKVGFSEEEAGSIIRSILNGLAYIHSKDYIHRDLKPENIVFKEEVDINRINNAYLKIVDFGLSAAYKSTMFKNNFVKVGTFLYMAPEQTTTEPYGKVNILTYY
jgi:calcium/calmodulin-dependent protein kinase I